MDLPGKRGMVAPGVTDSMGTQIYPHFKPKKENKKQKKTVHTFRNILIDAPS
jgi:hypothetical protein